MSLKLLLTSETVCRWWKMLFLRETRYEIEDDFMKLLYDKCVLKSKFGFIRLYANDKLVGEVYRRSFKNL